MGLAGIATGLQLARGRTNAMSIYLVAFVAIFGMGYGMFTPTASISPRPPPARSPPPPR